MKKKANKGAHQLIATGVSDYHPVTIDTATRDNILDQFHKQNITVENPEQFFSDISSAMAYHNAQSRLANEASLTQIRTSLSRKITLLQRLVDAYEDTSANEMDLIHYGRLATDYSNNNHAIKVELIREKNALSSALEFSKNYSGGRPRDHARRLLVNDLAKLYYQHTGSKPTRASYKSEHVTPESPFESLLRIVITLASGEEPGALYTVADEAIASLDLK